MTSPEPELPDRIFYAEFEENDLLFRAWMPAGADQPQEWTIRVHRGDELIREKTVPMMYAPVFGPDAADVAALEEASDTLLQELTAKD